MQSFGRVFGWSDLHVDYDANRRLVSQLSQQDYRADLLVLAGDVSSQPERVMATLGLLRERFREVAFVPGNHDLWVGPRDAFDSWDKLHALRARCRGAGIRTDPFTCSVGHQSLRILPVLAWYLKPEEGGGSLFLAKPGEDPALSMWADNHRIKWPALPGGRPVAEHLLALNEEAPGSEPCPATETVTISFSHFLPRVELVFGDRDRLVAEGAVSGGDRAPEFNFTRVAGCRQIDTLLRRHRSVLHLYGHQHRNRDRRIDGVRYLSHCLGYPGEPAEPATRPDRRWPLELRLNE